MSQTVTSPAPRALLSATDLALISAFAALTSALAYIGAVPVGSAGVPVTLQLLGIGLAGALLGPLRGFLSTCLYLALGAIGLPVFAEHSSGIGVFTGVSAGYLWAFPLTALVIGVLVKYMARERGKTRALVMFVCVFAAVALVEHPLGIAGMKFHQDVSWSTAAAWDGPFWLGDVLKSTIIAIVAAEVHRAFPHLLRSGR